MSSGNLEAGDLVQEYLSTDSVLRPSQSRRSSFLLETDEFIHKPWVPVFVNIPLNGRKQKVSWKVSLSSGIVKMWMFSARTEPEYVTHSCECQGKSVPR